MKNHINNIHYFLHLFLAIFLCIPVVSWTQGEPLRVFDANQGNPKSWMKYQHLDNAWYGHLHRLADQYLDERASQLKACTTKKAWEERKSQLKKRLLQSIGGLPDKTSLNARTVATLERPGFTVEKLYYESLPGFYVTACLFLPKERQAPAPAVIYCSGHTEEGFRSPTYQRVILNLVQKGFIVLAFDPIGQGERYQYLDDQGKPNIGGPTKEHSYAGIQCLLTGGSVARYMIHDGIRAVDYLLSRSEVDPSRIGITGRSGGGTQSAYIAAFDDRIKASAPENYITSFRRIWQSIGPQDAEQNFLSAQQLGIDHGDLLAIRAPKPTLVLTTTRDFFSIQGAKETFAEARKIYRFYNAEDQLQYSEDDFGHGSTLINREALYAFFQRSLELPGDTADMEVALFTEEELQISQTGQVLTALNSKGIFELNKESYTPPNLIEWNNKKALMQNFEKSGISAPKEKPNAVFTGRIKREGIQIEKYFLEFPSGRYPIPFFKINGEPTPNTPIILYLNSKGKAAGMGQGGEIEQLVNAGYTVIAPDLLNVGELSAYSFQGDSHIQNISYNLVLGSSLVGKSLVALQMEDLLVLMQYMRNQSEEKELKYIAIADQGLSIPLLHLAIMDKNIDQIILKQPLVSWSNLLQTQRYQAALAYVVIPGALLQYDIPHLMRALAPAKLTVINPQNANGKTLTQPEANEHYKWVKEEYIKKGKPSAFMLKTEVQNIDVLNHIGT